MKLDDLVYSKEYDTIGILTNHVGNELTLNVINVTGEDDIIYANRLECVLATTMQVYAAMLVSALSKY